MDIRTCKCLQINSTAGSTVVDPVLFVRQI